MDLRDRFQELRSPRCANWRAQGKWHYFELPDSYISSQSLVELYPVQLAFKVLGARHQFDDVNEIVLPDGARIPFESTSDGFPLKVIYGQRRSGATPHAHIASASAFIARPSKLLALIWRRLGFPSEERLRGGRHLH